MKKRIRIALLVVALLSVSSLIVVGYRYVQEAQAVDSCLSGKHGSFDYSSMTCDLNENHAYVPYHVRHPLDKSIAVVSLLAFALSTLVYLLLRNLEPMEDYGPNPHSERG